MRLKALILLGLLASAPAFNSTSPADLKAGEKLLRGGQHRKGESRGVHHSGNELGVVLRVMPASPRFSQDSAHALRTSAA